jgi:hypothetical protein
VGVESRNGKRLVRQVRTPIPTEGSALQGRIAAAEQSDALPIPVYAPLQGGRGNSSRHRLHLGMPRVQKVQHLLAVPHIARIVSQLHALAPTL